MAGKGKAKMFSDKKSVLGLNGLGRIGKLTLWNHISRKHFSEIVVNIFKFRPCSSPDVHNNFRKVFS